MLYFLQTLSFFILVPSGPPRNREVYNVTKTSCEIRWSPIPDENQNGIIIGYELNYKSPFSALQNVSLDAHTSSYRLTGLHSFVDYRISIVGVTSAGPGLHSYGPRLLCTTEADCKYHTTSIFSNSCNLWENLWHLL